MTESYSILIPMQVPEDVERWRKEREHNRDLGDGRGALSAIGATTRVPTKYLLVDRETGDVWGYDEQGVTQRVYPLRIVTETPPETLHRPHVARSGNQEVRTDD